MTGLRRERPTREPVDGRAWLTLPCACRGYISMPDRAAEFEAGDIMRAHQSTVLHRLWREAHTL